MTTTSYLLNLDDDVHGRTPAHMRTLYAAANGLCPWCTVCGDWHWGGSRHTPLPGVQRDAVAQGVLSIAAKLEARMSPVTTCEGCGCLVRELESCPSCRARALHHPSCPQRLDLGAECLAGCRPRAGEHGSALLSALVILGCWAALVGFAIMLLAGWSDWWPSTDSIGR